jgi:hypothetical protein
MSGKPYSPRIPREDTRTDLPITRHDLENPQAERETVPRDVESLNGSNGSAERHLLHDLNEPKNSRSQVVQQETVQRV